VVRHSNITLVYDSSLVVQISSRAEGCFDDAFQVLGHPWEPLVRRTHSGLLVLISLYTTDSSGPSTLDAHVCNPRAIRCRLHLNPH
jgi:hypothetical protein